MAGQDWGNCKGCKHFASSKPNPGDQDQAECRQPELRNFELKLTGSSGCNAFEARGETRAAPPAP